MKTISSAYLNAGVFGIAWGSFRFLIAFALGVWFQIIF